MLATTHLQELLQAQAGPHVSLFMPTYRKGSEQSTNVVRWKNLLREARGRLRDYGCRDREVDEILQPAQEFLSDGGWQQHLADGLAAFLSRRLFRYFHLPYSLEELVVVSDRFHLKPLLPMLTNDKRFYVLTLSQKEVRLLQATRTSINEVTVDNIPESVDDILKYYDFEKQIQYHPQRPGSGRQRAVIFHGHGAHTKDRKEDIKEYFRQIDRGLHEILRDETAPLVLAGVDYLLSIYRNISSYRHLLAEGIEGNADQLTNQQLHDAAWQGIEPLLIQVREQAAAQYQEAAGRGAAVNTVKEAVPAAYEGRLALLFVPLGIQQWGRFDPQTLSLEVHETYQPGDQDLLDVAAIHTFAHGGSVYVVAPEDMPDTPVAAVLRY